MDITTINENSSVLAVQITTWTGQKRLTKEELGEASRDLPPESLATLGSKKLVSPDDLNPISQIRKKVERYLRSISVKFLSGWLISNAKVPATVEFLEESKAQFQSQVDAFLNDYDEKVRAWASNFPDWQRLLDIEPAEKLSRKFSFSWQVARVIPTGNVTVDEGLAKEVKRLPDRAFEDIATDAQDLWEKNFKGRSEVINRGLVPLKRLVGKMTGLAFINSNLIPLAENLQIALSAIDKNDKTVSGNKLQAIVGALLTICNPNLAEEHSLGLIEEEKLAMQQPLPLTPPPIAPEMVQSVTPGEPQSNWVQIEW